MHMLEISSHLILLLSPVSLRRVMAGSWGLYATAETNEAMPTVYAEHQHAS